MPPKAVKRISSGATKKAPKTKSTKVDNNMDDVLGAVKALTEKVATLEKKIDKKSEDHVPSTSQEPDITIDDLRQMTPLAQRADALIQDIGSIATTPSAGKKNPRLSQKRAIIKTIHWPHQFVHRPGASDIAFDEITMGEFVAGTSAILLLPELPPHEARCRLQHLQYLMHLSRSVSWDRVRNLYAAALEDIQTGQRQWNDTLVDLKETLLPVTGPAKTTNTVSSPTPCRRYNWAECKTSKCTFPHACNHCWSALGEYKTHPAKRCFQIQNKSLPKNGEKPELKYTPK